jgi:hypothetical protein
MLRVAAGALVVAGVNAQGAPDFSGRWTLVPDAPAEAPAPGQRGGRGRVVPGTMGSGWGPTITLTQDATTLTVEYQPYVPYDMQRPLKFVYLLNGSESRNTINAGRGPQEQISKVTWAGSSLVITTAHSFKNPQSGATDTSETKQVLSLESPAVLVVETTRSGVMGGPASTTMTKYRK